eukprot:739016-Prymnesium_polylepis.1
MYQHPLTFGAREYFLTDREFEEHCYWPRTAPEVDVYDDTTSSNLPRCKTFADGSTQTEPEERTEASRDGGSTRLVRVLP